MKQLIKNAQNSISILRNSVIGIFILYDTKYLVLEYDSDIQHLHCIRISILGAISELFIFESEGRYCPIPEEYESLEDLIQKPTEYFEWCSINNL